MEKRDGKSFSSPVSIVEPRQLKAVTSRLAWKIVKLLGERPSYPKEIAKKLKVHEQKVYYHIRNLEKAGLIKKIHEETRQGALTKIYSLANDAFAFVLKPLKESSKIMDMRPEHKKFLEPFIEDGNFSALIIMGSPEPHGPQGVRAKDGPTATALGMFLGTFLSYLPEDCIKVDTQVRKEDLKKNLILIGGPRVNAVTSKINRHLPVRFLETKDHYVTGLYSSVTNKTYSEEEGLVVKTKNPFSKKREILVIGGKGRQGTKAALLAFLQNFDELCKGNSYDRKILARVVEGIDTNSDGAVDSMEFLE